MVDLSRSAGGRERWSCSLLHVSKDTFKDVLFNFTNQLSPMDFVTYKTANIY